MLFAQTIQAGPLGAINLLFGFLGGIGVALLVQVVQAYFRHRHYLTEKLLDRYAEFLGVASLAVDDATSLVSGLVFSRNVPQEAAGHSELSKVNSRRHERRRDLLRLSFQIRLLETNVDLLSKVQEVTDSLPFMAFAVPPSWHEGNYNERFEKYQNDIGNFKKKLNALTSAAFKVHAASKFFRVGRFRTPEAAKQSAQLTTAYVDPGAAVSPNVQPQQPSPPPEAL